MPPPPEGIVNKGFHGVSIARNHCAITISFAKQTDKILVPQCLSNLVSFKKVAFTLAEVLITLGIIGVVATMTMPTLIEQHQKKAAVVRLQKFYSTMNQAIQMWQTNEGIMQGEPYSFPSDVVNNGSKSLEWYNNNIGKYMPAIKSSSGGMSYDVVFKDGSGFSSYIGGSGTMFIMFCVQYKYCNGDTYDGRNSFLFTFYNGKLYTSLTGMQNSSRDELLQLCKYGNFDYGDRSSPNRRHACARLIEYDGWQMKDDYPWRQTILEN